MRHRTWDQWRDLVVRHLARLSLVAALAVLAVFFVGSAASGQASQRAADSVRPAGVAIGVAGIGGGMLVLVIGAFRPLAPRDRADPRDLSRG